MPKKKKDSEIIEEFKNYICSKAGIAPEFLFKKIKPEIDISEAARIMGRKGGKVGGKSRSPEKQDASRENGKKGGRPKGRPRKKEAKING